MRFHLCKDEGSILSDEPIDRRALLTSCSSSPARSSTDHRKPGKLRVFSFSELEVATGGFAKPSLLGKGSNGSFYKGTLKDGRLVAVKRQENAQDEAAFKNELEILSTLHSHRFVNLVGFSQGPNPQDKLLVVEFTANGTLHDNLHRSGPTLELLGWSMRVQIAIQVGKALLALHSANPPVIHRDVKSASIVIDGKWNAKLGDFGLALRVLMIDDVGVVADVDPETPPSSHISTKVDVYSFGILLLEMLSGRKAIDARFKPPTITDWAIPLIKQGKAHAIYDRRLILDPQCARALKLLAGLAARCVRRSALRRPSMSYVVAALQEVSKKIPLPKWVGLASVIKRTSGCQTPEIDVRATADFVDDVRSARTTNIGKEWLADKPVPSRKAVGGKGIQNSLQGPNKHGSGRMVGRVGSLDRQIKIRLEAQRAKAIDRAQVQEVQPEKMDEEEDSDDDFSRDDDFEDLPRALKEVSTNGRRRIYNEWRNPVFDSSSTSPERASALSRSARHEVSPTSESEEGRAAAPSNAAAQEGSTCGSTTARPTMPNKSVSWSFESTPDFAY